MGFAKRMKLLVHRLGETFFQLWVCTYLLPVYIILSYLDLPARQLVTWPQREER